MSCDLQYRLQSRKRLRILAAGVVGVVLLALADLMTGSSGMKLAAVLQALLQGPEAGTAEAVIVWSIRLPMTLTAFFVGAALSLAGLQIQNITGNALASPSTLGISSAAGFGAAGAITAGFTIFGMLWLGTALAAFFAALRMLKPIQLEIAITATIIPIKIFLPLEREILFQAFLMIYIFDIPSFDCNNLLPLMSDLPMQSSIILLRLFHGCAFSSL